MKGAIIKSGACFISVLALFLLTFNTAFALTFAGLVDKVVDVLATSVVRLIFALAFVYFMWGVVQYTLYPDGESKDKGRQMMIWGIIGLTVMFSVYALVRLLGNTLSLL